MNECLPYCVFKLNEDRKRKRCWNKAYTWRGSVVVCMHFIMFLVSFASLPSSLSIREPNAHRCTKHMCTLCVCVLLRRPFVNAQAHFVSLFAVLRVIHFLIFSLPFSHYVLIRDSCSYGQLLPNETRLATHGNNDGFLGPKYEEKVGSSLTFVQVIARICFLT